MKNKRLLVLMSVFVFIVIIVVLCSSFFSVKNINVSWQGELSVLAEVPEEELINSIEVKRIDSIFLVKRSKCVRMLEQKYPYIKVESIEKKLPNRITLNLSERQEMFIVKIQDGLYAYLDDTGRVLKVGEGSPIGSKIYPCMLYFDGMSVMRENFIEGQDADIAVLNILIDITRTLKEQGCSVKDSYDFLKKITVRTAYNTHVEIVSNYGLTIVLRKVDADLCEKLEYGLGLYRTYRQQSKVGEIAVFRDGTGSISSTFSSL